MLILCFIILYVSSGFSQELPELIPYRKGYKWGYCNQKKELLIPAIYDDAFMFHKGLGRVFKDGYFGFVNTKGELLVDFKYEDPTLEKNYGSIFYFSEEGLMNVYRDGKWGFIDTTGKEVIPCIYETAYNFSEGLARVEKEGLWGFINPKGEVIIPLQYDLAHDFEDGLAPVEKNGLVGLIDTLGDTIIPFEYEYIYSGKHSEGLIAVMREKFRTCGYIDIKNNVVIPLEYYNATPFSEGLAKVYKDGWGFINTKGEEVVPRKYGLADSFKDSLAVVADDDFKFGAINHQGEKVIDLEYDLLHNGILDGNAVKTPYKLERFFFKHINEGLIPAYKNGKAGVIDYQGKIVIPFIYEYVSVFEQGLAIVIKDNQYGYIDRYGTEYFE